LAGLILGVIVGVLASASGPFREVLAPYRGEVKTAFDWLAFPGKLFLKTIQMVIMPLILASIVRGLASARDVAQMRSLGIQFGAYVVTSSVAAAVLAIILCDALKPGSGLSMTAAVGGGTNAGRELSFLGLSPDLLLGFLPVNPLASLVQGQMLEVVVIAVIGGISLLQLQKSQAEVVLSLLEATQNICMIVIGWAMKVAPFAVFGLIAQVASTIGFNALSSMGAYVFVSFVGFAALITCYSVIVWVWTGKSPIKFLASIAEPVLLAFSTSSSAATMPVTMQIAEDKLGIEPTVARFLIPLGTTVNMAGSAIWQTTAIVFIAQVYQIEFSVPQLGFVVATAVVSAIGSPGVPGVGVGILAAVLGKLGIPLEGVSLILGVDRLVDMGCTVVNVVGDLTACELFGGKRRSFWTRST
jgi:Na+/H+-dicarboxylate symporter